MKKTRYIKEGIELELVKKPRKIIAILYVDDVRIQLCKVNKISEDFWVLYEYNENYLVIYSRGCMANQIPLTVEAVYDMTNKKTVPVLNKNKVIFEHMCISKKYIDTSVILEFLNDRKLEIADDEEVEDFIRYVTAGNETISNEEIKEYILSEYPQMKKFMNFETPLTVKEYRKIVANIEDNIRLHIMPNLLKDEYLR